MSPLEERIVYEGVGPGWFSKIEQVCLKLKTEAITKRRFRGWLGEVSR